MLDLKSGTRIVLARDILLRAEEELGRYYAFNTRSGDHFSLNHTAYWALQQTCGGITCDDLLNAFREQYGLDPDTASTDLSDTLTDAYTAGIIEEDR